jgi:hypothetical protein
MILRVFQGEVALQCRFIARAGSRLDAALAAGDTDDAWLLLQVILTSAANVSKLLWGSSGNREKERGLLRQSLATPDDSVLRDPDLRNDFEHFDERVERWFAKETPRIYLARNIAPEGQIQLGVPYERFQHFDPETGEVTFWDNTVSVPAVVAEAQRILKAAEIELNRWMQPPEQAA